MDEQKELQWILIRRFIEILFLVGVTEYLLMSVLNNLALPVVYDYFFPHQERNLTYGNAQMLLELLVTLGLLMMNAVGSLFPLTTRQLFGRIFKQTGVSTAILTMSRGRAFLLFLAVLAGTLLLLLPYLIGAFCFARITAAQFDKMEQERVREQKEYDRKRNLMLSDVAHDLRTPMTTVSGYAKALTDGMVEDKEKQREYLMAIQRKSVRMNELIELLFEYVKLDSAGFTLNRKKVDLYELLRENAAMLYSDLEEAGMEFEIDIPETALYVQADAIQLSRVITNLLNNAKKHNPSGCRIALQAWQNQREICVTVADNGPLIPEELAEQLFEPLSRGDTSRGSEGGSGLGLSIAKKIVEMHGWNLTLEQYRGQTEDGYTKKFKIEMMSNDYDSFFQK